MGEHQQGRNTTMRDRATQSRDRGWSIPGRFQGDGTIEEQVQDCPRVLPPPALFCNRNFIIILRGP
jgi:hypothetical protein